MALEFVQVKEEPMGEAPPSECTMHVVNQELMVELKVVQYADLKKRVEMESRSRTTVEQFTALLEFMEKHGDLGRAGPCGAGRLRGDRLWTQLAQQLSTLAGGVRKTTHKWKKVWADWKTKTKKKALEIRARGDPSGPPRPPGPRASLAGRAVLSPLERRLLAVMAAAGLPTRLADAPQEPFLSPPSPPPPPELPPPAPLLPPAPPVIVPDVEAPPPPKPARSPRPSRAGFTRHRRRRPRSRLEGLERRRLRLEDERDRRLHERETEKLQLEAKRIQADCERNIQLKRIADVAHSFMDKWGLMGGPGVSSEDGVS